MGARNASRGLAPSVLALAALALIAVTARAKDAPLYEFGLGVGAIAFQDYRGADTTHAYPVPVPYLLYNGKFLKSDRDGVRGTLFNQDRVEINLSFNATTPVRSNRTRSGMPDLKSTVEIGPALNVHLLRSDDDHYKFDFRMPLRSAITIQNGAPHAIGWTLAPQFDLDVSNAFGRPGWNLGVLAGPLFADRRYHEYFYSVAPQYATAARPAYQASSGYAGLQTTSAISKRFATYWVGAYVRYDALSGAAFEASPLVQRTHYWSAGFGISWMIKTSAQMVDVPE